MNYITTQFAFFTDSILLSGISVSEPALSSWIFHQAMIELMTQILHHTFVISELSKQKQNFWLIWFYNSLFYFKTL